MDVWDYVFGVFRILIGAFLALWAGTAFFITLNFASDINALAPHNADYSGVVTFVTVLFATPITAVMVGQTAAFPMLLIVGWSEVNAKKDAVFFMLAGVVMGVILIGYGASKQLPFTSDIFRCLVVISSCIVGLLVYWLVAGRKAGRFLNRPAV